MEQKDLQVLILPVYINAVCLESLDLSCVLSVLRTGRDEQSHWVEGKGFHFLKKHYDKLLEFQILSFIPL